MSESSDVLNKEEWSREDWKKEGERVNEEIKKLYDESPKPFDAMGHQVNRFDGDALARLLAQDSFIRPVRSDVLTILNTQIHLSTVVTISQQGLHCWCCGDEIPVYYDGKKFFLGRHCPYPEGIPLTVELNVPSGVMMVTDDLRPAFDVGRIPERYGKFYSANYDIGKVRFSKLMEEIGCAHLSVGQSFPGVYRTDRDRKSFIIARHGYDEDKDQEVHPEGRLVTSIDTELRWCSLVDRDEYLRRGCEGKYEKASMVSVHPGVYAFTHFIHLSNFVCEKNKPIIFTHIEWVRPPDPVKDYQKMLREADELADALDLPKEK